MTEPPVREIGRVADSNGMQLIVGVDFGRVTIGHEQMEAWELGPEQRDDFQRLFMQADTAAVEHAARYAEFRDG